MTKYIKILTILTLSLFCNILIGQKKKDTSTEYTINRGDLLSVEVMDHMEFNRPRILVLPDGYIQYPALGTMKVVGLTPKELAKKIRTGLDSKYVVNPIVTIYIHSLERQDINIFGKVRSPGVYVIYEPTELLRAISLAGGVEKIKNSTHIIIVNENGIARTVKLKKYIRTMKKNKIMIDKGDSIYIKSFDVNWSLLSFLISAATLTITIMRYT